jgi:hypothetical protein
MTLSEPLAFVSDSDSYSPPPVDDDGWPEEIADAAYHGIVGAFVRAIEPHSEADPSALLVHLLVGLGNVIGKTMFRIADGAYHYCNLFAVCVGPTGHGRKGTAWARVREPLKLIDPIWADSIASGLSSGEGLIWFVRDPISETVPIKEKGRATGDYDTYIADPGVTDKRRLIVQTEFSATMKAANRLGNTLSDTMRQAWDDGNLRIINKNSPAIATDAHISIVGHITKEELRKLLDSTEAANGWGNRILWLCVRRTKLLPFGGELDRQLTESFAKSCRAVLEFARAHAGPLEFDIDARDRWESVYPQLTTGRPGLVGNLLARGEAQTLRLACLYATLDRQTVIGTEHLKAALAVWEYAERSVESIFGDRSGDPDMDAILAALRSAPDGMTRTQISSLFARHLSTSRIDQALASLLKANLIRVEKVRTTGRPMEIWRANQK